MVCDDRARCNPILYNDSLEQNNTKILLKITLPRVSFKSFCLEDNLIINDFLDRLGQVQSRKRTDLY